MMTFPKMVVPLFINREPRQMRYSTIALNGLLYGLMLADVGWLQNYPNTPWLYKSGIPYVIEPPGHERWQSIPAAQASRKADCEDLAAWRAAELRVRKNVAALAKNIWRPVGNQLRAHAFVLLPDGSTEDPSEVQGMPSVGLHRPGRPWPPNKIPSGYWNPPTGSTY